MVVPNKVPDFDLLVIGGGILGVGVAAVVAQRGYSVMLVRLPDREKPRADTLRNQSWLQSGLMYIDRFEDHKRGLLLAKKMFHWGNTMLSRLGIALPTDDQRGILRVRTEQEAEELMRDANALRISKLVKPLSEAEVKRRLADVYEPNGLYFAIPDAPFDEASVLMELRKAASKSKAVLTESSDPVRFSSSNSMLQIEIDGQTVTSRATVCAAGAGNISLREQAGLDAVFSVRQTPLLVLNHQIGTNASLFADRTHGWSFTRQSSDVAPPDGAFVIGTRVHSQVTFQAPDNRRIPKQDIVKFRECLPDHLKDACDRGRFTAGYEVIPNISTGANYVEPWIERHPSFPGLLFAMPGRATLGLFTAYQLADKVIAEIGGPRRSSPRLATDTPSSAFLGWNGRVHMHFESYYNFNDYM